MNESQKEVFVYCWNKLVDMGLTKGQIIAIMANMFQESRLSPTNYQMYDGIYNPDYWDRYNADDNMGYGLFQWSYPSRKKQLKDFLLKNSTISVKICAFSLEILTVLGFLGLFSVFSTVA